MSDVTYELTEDEFDRLARYAQSRHPTTCHEDAPKFVSELRDREEPDYACEVHEIRELPSGYDECPQCQHERDVQAREQERMARRADPNMHNMVDAPANAIDHSRDPSDFI